MPTYAYHCNTCGKDFDRSQRMSDAALTICECGEKGQVARQISAGSGLIFKGSGFYITDYKNGSNGGSGGAKAPAGADAAPAKESTSSATAAAAPAAGCGATQCCMASKTD